MSTTNFFFGSIVVEDFCNVNKLTIRAVLMGSHIPLPLIMFEMKSFSNAGRKQILNAGRVVVVAMSESGQVSRLGVMAV